MELYPVDRVIPVLHCHHLAVVRNGRVFVRSGAGIVADSVPEKEYQECINKAGAVMDALRAAEEVEL